MAAEFDVTFQAVSMDTSADEVRRILNRNGAVILRRVLTSEQVDRVNRELDPMMIALGEGNFGKGEQNYVAAFSGHRTKRLQHCVKYSETYREAFLSNDSIADYVAALLSGRVGTHSLFASQAIEIWPGETTQALHRDGSGFQQRLGLDTAGSVELVVNTLLALTDVTEEMGATRVVPGSHAWPDFSMEARPEETVPVPLEAGDVLLLSGKLIHGGGANATQDRPRRVISTSWTSGFFKSEEAWPFILSVDEVRGYGRTLQSFLGFRSVSYKDEDPGFLWRAEARPLEDYLGL